MKKRKNPQKYLADNCHNCKSNSISIYSSVFCSKCLKELNKSKPISYKNFLRLKVDRNRYLKKIKCLDLKIQKIDEKIEKFHLQNILEQGIISNKQNSLNICYTKSEGKK